MQPVAVYRSREVTVPYPRYATLVAPVWPMTWIVVTILASVFWGTVPVKAFLQEGPSWLVAVAVGMLLLQCAAICFWLLHRFNRRNDAFKEFTQFNQPVWCAVTDVRIIATTTSAVGEKTRVRASIDNNTVVDFSVEALQRPRLLELGFLAIRRSNWSYIVDGALDQQQCPIPTVPDLHYAAIVQNQTNEPMR